MLFVFGRIRPLPGFSNLLVALIKAYRCGHRRCLHPAQCSYAELSLPKDWPDVARVETARRTHVGGQEHSPTAHPENAQKETTEYCLDSECETQHCRDDDAQGMGKIQGTKIMGSPDFDRINRCDQTCYGQDPSSYKTVFQIGMAKELLEA